MANIYTTLLYSILLTNTVFALEPRPIFFFHEFGASCQKYEALKLSDEFICLESGKHSASFLSLKYQTENICKTFRNSIEKSKKAFKHIDTTGFYLMGIEQGGLIARYLLHYCDNIKPFIKGIITIGTPNLGVDDHRILHETKEEGNIKQWANTLTTKAMIMLKDLSSKEPIFAPFQYHNLFEPINSNRIDSGKVYTKDLASKSDSYMNFGDLIFDVKDSSKILVKKPYGIIKELLDNTNTADDYGKLDIFLNFMLLEEDIKPLATQTFGAKFNDMENKIENFKNTQAYQEKFMGLNAIYDNGILKNCFLDEDFMSFNVIHLNNISRLLSTDKCKQLKDNTDLTINEKYTICLHKNYRDYDFRQNYACDSQEFSFKVIEERMRIRKAMKYSLKSNSSFSNPSQNNKASSMRQSVNERRTLVDNMFNFIKHSEKEYHILI